MTKQEFIHQNAADLQRYRRRSFVALGLGLSVIISMAVLGIPLLEQLKESDLFDRPIILIRSWFECMSGLILLSFTLAFSRVRQIFGVECPHCRARLFFLSAKLALMTGNCAHCGERVIHEQI